MAKKGQGKPKMSWAERKELNEAKREAARKHAVDVICNLMETEGLKWVKEWESIAWGPQRGASGVPYRGVNQLHLMIAAWEKGYEDPRWFTSNNAVLKDGDGNETRYHVKKGEKATRVEHWRKQWFWQDDDGAIHYVKDKGKVPEGRKPEMFYAFDGMWPVFNAEQLVDFDGNPMPKKVIEIEPKELDEELCEVADRLIETSRCEVVENKSISQACYRPATDEVMMPSRLAFSDMRGFVTTLTHEMTHSTMKPLGRMEGSGNSFGSEKYAFEELVAELGSTFTCLELGVHRVAELEGDENFQNHAAYLKSWMRKFQENPDTLFDASRLASNAATYLIDNYNGGKRPPAAAAGKPAAPALVLEKRAEIGRAQTEHVAVPEKRSQNAPAKLADDRQRVNAKSNHTGRRSAPLVRR